MPISRLKKQSSIQKKATLEAKEVNIAAEKGEHSAKGAKVSEKALAKF